MSDNVLAPLLNPKQHYNIRSAIELTLDRFDAGLVGGTQWLIRLDPIPEEIFFDIALI